LNEQKQRMSRRLVSAAVPVALAAAVGVAAGRATADGTDALAASVVPPEAQACRDIPVVAVDAPVEASTDYTVRVEHADGAGSFDVVVHTGRRARGLLALGFGIPASYSDTTAAVEGVHRVMVVDPAGEILSDVRLTIHPADQAESSCATAAAGSLRGHNQLADPRLPTPSQTTS
jgi:hypothetical protein